MKNFLHLKSGRSTLTVAFAAFVPLTAGNLYAALDNSDPSEDIMQVPYNSAPMEEGTIPAARPEPTQSSLGAEGPIREDASDKQGTDPSIRDTNPLTVDGLWVILPGNRVVRPGED